MSEHLVPTAERLSELQHRLADGPAGYQRELLALQRRFRKVRDRDYFGAPGRAEAASAVDGCLGYRQGISLKLTARTDSHHKVD